MIWQRRSKMAIVTVTVHGEILDLDNATPAVGTVTFKTLTELRDTVDNVIYEPATWVETLDVNGEFTIVLPATDSPDITPTGWNYQVSISTTGWRRTFYFSLPTTLAPAVEFADLIPIDDPVDCTPDGTACAPISVVGEVAALQADVDTLEITQGALVNTVNILSPIVFQSQTDVGVLQGQMAGVLANPGLTGPTAFVNLTTVHANIILGAVPAASRLERGGDATRVRGFLQATGVVASGAVLANIATVAHRPLHPVSMGARYTAGTNRLQVAVNGDVTFTAALALNDQLWLDGVTFDLLA